MARLLREWISLESSDKLIEEAKKAKVDNSPLLIPALLQRADSLNQNDRIYPRAVLEREVANYQKVVSENRSGGELDHPDSSVVALQNVSHKIKEIWWDGDEVKGIVEIHPSLPKGKDALGLLEAGMKIGISSRGVGETVQTEEGYDMVDDSFMLIAFDLVSEPSTHEAWLMREGKNLDKNEIRQMISKVDRINRIANEILRG